MNKVEEPSLKKSRQENNDVNSLRERMRSTWPKDFIYSNTGMSESFTHLCVDHGAPHDNSALEWWSLNGRTGENQRFGVFVAFLRFAISGNEEARCVKDPISYAAAVSWVIVDHEQKKYYRFSEVDYRTPLLASYFAGTGKYTADENFFQAVSEQLSQHRLPLPDRVMEGPTSIRLDVLDLQYRENKLMVIPRVKKSKKSPFPCYKLILSGTTFESGDSNLREEVKAELEIIFQPKQHPVLHGNKGIVNFNEDWSNEMFHYLIPHCTVLEGTINVTRASDDFEIIQETKLDNGKIWMDHSFGSALPKNIEEINNLKINNKKYKNNNNLWNCCSIRLDNNTDDAISIMYLLDSENWKIVKAYTVIQSGKTGKFENHYDGIEFNSDNASQFRSDNTGLLFATRWSLSTPFFDNSVLKATIEVSFPDQEFTTIIAQPSIWLGTISMSGKIITNDGNSIDVTGEGFLKSHGKGNLKDITELHDVLRDVSTAVMEKKEVNSFKTLEEIFNGPAASATSTVKTVMSLQNQSLSNSQLVIFTALLATYGFIFHHPMDEKEVLEVLQWCHGKWLSYFGSIYIDNKTLMIRSFMLRELSFVLENRCKLWIPSHVQVIDLVISPPNNLKLLFLKNNNFIDHIIPDSTKFTVEVSKLDISKLKALAEGAWVFDSSRGKGNIGFFLGAQNIKPIWRSFLTNLSPTLVINVDEEKRRIKNIIQISLFNIEHLIQLDGTYWNWYSTGRGLLRSRACVLPDGAGFYIETPLPDNNMLERKWYTFEDGGKSMLVSMSLFKDNENGNIQPISACVQYFNLRLEK